MNAFLLEFYHPVCLRFAEQLRVRLNVRPQLVTSSHLHEAQVRKSFPEGLYLHGSDAKSGNWPADFPAVEHAPFDAACEHIWRNWPHQMTDLFRRWDHSGDYTQLEMTLDFYQQLVAWNHLFKLLKPDFICFWEPPHVPYTLILYALAAYHKVPVMLIEVCAGPFSLACNDLSAGGSQWRQALRLASWECEAGFQVNPCGFHPENRAFIERATNSSYDKGMPWWQSNMLSLKHNAFDSAFFKKLWRILKRSLKADFRHWRKRRTKEAPRPSLHGIYAHKEWQRPLRTSFRSGLAQTKFGLAEIRNHFQTIQFGRGYQRYTTKKSPEETRYILACLHFQPEMTSNPRGDIFLHQWLLINLLAASVPENVEVWVKEHPVQFVSFGGASSFRNRAYYEMISRMPKTRLIPVEANQFDLIDNSLAVATISGTVGLESIARGKPALVFGNVWYERCAGAWRVRDLETCRAAVVGVLAGSPAKGVPFEVMLKELEVSAFRFGSEASLVGEGKDTTDENIRGLVDQVALLLDLPLASDPITVNLAEILGE